MKFPPIINKVLVSYFRFIALGVVVLVMVVGYLSLIAPKLAEVRTTEATTRRNAEAELKTQQEYLVDLKASNEKFNATLSSTQRKEIDDFIPSDPDFPGLLLTVENIVSQARLNLDSFSVGQVGQLASGAGSSTGGGGAIPTAQAATVGGISFHTQDVSITVSGGTSYATFKSLLGLFEQSRRLFDIISVGYSAGKGESGAEGAAWNLVLRTYYLPPQL